MVRKALRTAIGFILLLIPVSAVALPPGEGKDLVESVCSSCHGTRVIERSSGYSREDWPWMLSLGETYQRWLYAIHISLQKADELQSAAILYVGKVAEKALVDNILVPFSHWIEDPALIASGAYRDMSRFLKGGRPPSIGGFVRLLSAVQKPESSTEESIVKEFRRHLDNIERNSRIRLRDPEILAALETLAKLRNDAAHIEDPGSNDVRLVANLIAEEDQPGLLIESLGILAPKAA